MGINTIFMIYCSIGKIPELQSTMCNLVLSPPVGVCVCVVSELINTV